MANRQTIRGGIEGIIDQQTGSYDSSGILSDRDGNLFERQEFIIETLLNQTPVNTFQSIALSPNLDTISRFSVNLFDINGNAFPENEIVLTNATITLEQSCDGYPFTTVGISQPTLTKGTGFIATAINFISTEWDIDCLYRLTISGVEIHDGVNFNLQTFIWNNIISQVADIDSEVDFIMTAVTLPSANDVENTTVAHVLGNKLDTIAGDSIVALNKQLLANLAIVDTETDKIADIKTETDKISSVKNTVEAITGYAIDSTVAKAINLALVKTETDKIPSEVIKTAAIKVETDKIPATITKIDAIKVETDNITGEVVKTSAIKTETDKIPATITKIDTINTNTTPRAQKVYPTLADGVTVTGGGAWVLGSFTQIVAANIITSSFQIIGINVASCSANDTYEFVLYSGALNSEVEIGRIRFTRVTNTYQIGFVKIETTVIAANSRISAKIASSTGNDNAVVSIVYK